MGNRRRHGNDLAKVEKPERRKNGGRVKAQPISVVVGIPLERTVPSSAFSHFWEIARRGYPLIHRLYSRTDVNRNEFARQLLESDYTHLVMLDLDHRHPFDVVEKLMRWAAKDRDKYQVVGGLNFRRGKPYFPCIFMRGPDGELHYPLEWPQGIFPVQALGHGCLMIDRRVFEKLGNPPWWQYGYPEWEEDYQYPTEDMYFSALCEQAGIKMWCDSTITSPHLTEAEVDENMFLRFLAKNPPKKVAVGDEIRDFDPQRDADLQKAKKKTSVIIPSTGRAEQLRACVKRLLETTAWDNVEVIVVIEHDVESLKAVEDLPIRVVYREEHRGPVFGWNEGAALASGDAFVLGADDLHWHDNWLGRALSVLEKNGGSGMVGLNDMLRDGATTFTTQYLVSRDYAVEKWGGVLCCPHYKHYFVDIEAYERAKRDGKYFWAPDAIVEQRHPSVGTAPEDETYRIGKPFYAIDGKLYEERLAQGFPNDYAAVFTLQPGETIQEKVLI